MMTSSHGDELMTPTPKLAGVTIVGTLAYLGLAVLGWGGFSAFFSHPARIALAFVLFVLAGVALFSGGNLSSGCWMAICRPTQTARSSGRSTRVPFAGWASCSSPPVVHCGSGLSSYLADGSADWWPSSPAYAGDPWRL